MIALFLTCKLASPSITSNLTHTRSSSKMKGTVHGPRVTPEGLKPSKEIATAVLDMPQPQHKATTRRFLGTITYLAKFCPNLSEVIRPLRDLKHIKQEFLWSEQHSKAATQVDALEYYLGAHCVNQPLTPMVPTTSNGNQSRTVPARFLKLNSATLKFKKKLFPLFTPFTNSISSFSASLILRFTAINNP